MKIGVITTFHGAPWGGSEELWFAMAQAALDAGDSIVVCLTQNTGEHGRFAQLISAGATIVWGNDRAAELLVRVARAVQRSARRAPRPVRRAAAIVDVAARRYCDRRSALRRFVGSRPDIVLINDGGSIPASDLLAEVLRVAGTVRYVILSHNNYGNVPGDSEREAVRAYYRGAARIAFVARATHLATERQLAASLPAIIVRNPVNLRDITPVPWPSRRPLRFATIAQLRVDWKGQDLLLDALSRPHWRGRDWQLSIFGSGIDEGYLRELIVHYDLAERVTLAGHATDIRAVWSEHHALVVSSRVESAPLVIVEAMLCARPVITTNVGGVAEWLDEGRSGFIAPAATGDSLDGALDRAWSARSDWATIGKQGHYEALARYDPQAGATLLQELRSLLRRDDEG